MILRYFLPFVVFAATLTWESWANPGQASIDAIFEVIRKNDVAGLSKLVADGANLNSLNSQGETPLIFAVDTGNLDLVRILVERGASLENKDINGQTALIHAAQRGHLNVVRILLAKGAKRDTKDSFPMDALNYAAENGHQQVAELIAGVARKVPSNDLIDFKFSERKEVNIQKIGAKRIVTLPNVIKTKINLLFPDYRLPTNSDIKGDWWLTCSVARSNIAGDDSHYSEIDLPFLLSEDLNNDNVVDLALILLPKKSSAGFAVVVFNGIKAGGYTQHSIEKASDVNANSYSVSGACALGYPDAKDEYRSVGIQIKKYEGDGTSYCWKKTRYVLQPEN